MLGIASLGKAVENYDYSSISSKNRDYVYDYIIKEIPDSYIETGGLKIWTSLDIDSQTSIENGLNLNNLEQEAKEQLGMQKLNPKQTIYVTLPKTDYIEPAAEEVIIEDSNTGLKGILNKILNMFK